VTDAQGAVVRTLRRLSGDAGVNRATWDFRYEGVPQPRGGEPPDPEREEAAERFGRGSGGPFVVPGTYTLTLRVDGRDYSKPVVVEGDPRTQVAVADLVAQRDKALELRDLNGSVTSMIDRSNDLLRQLTSLSENLRRNAPNEKGALAQADSALAQVKQLRDEKLMRPLAGLGYRQFPRLREEVTALYGMVSRSVSRPTDPQVGRSTELASEARQVQQELQAIVNGRIAKLNQLLAKLPHVIVAGGAIM
jgi:hypothetical protein